MLQDLSIRNFAIIDDLSINLEKGFTVLTGETGAGKSIIVNAVNQLLGSRASADMIRTSEEVAELEARFQVPSESPAARLARDQEIDLSDGLLIIRRTIHRNGRHKIFINGRMATVQMLSRINEHLASISGQHAHQCLLRPEEHLLLLDQFGGLAELRGQVRALLNEMLPLIKESYEIRSQQSRQTERRDLLAFQCREIRQAGITSDEDEDLDQELKRLKHARKLYEAVGRCLDNLYGAEGAAVEHVTEVARELQGLSDIDSSLGTVAERVQDAAYQLEDIAGGLRDYLHHLVFDGTRLEAVEERLSLLQRLKRKYGGSLEAVLAFAGQAEEELHSISSMPERLAEIEEKIDQLHARLCALSRELSEKRRKAAKQLSQKVQREMASLEMSGTRFEVRFARNPVAGGRDPRLILDQGAIEETGTDRVDFLIAPNVGEELRPLAHIASGGELSRIVLALRAILATKESVESLVFDEVDAGIGGGIAEVVGNKLRSLACFHQVICITHLPQIARYAEHHFKIAKEVYGKRTRTTIAPLHGDDRVQEIARMLGGVKITKKTIDHAREMLSHTT